nr:PAAR domain-containing protein [Burkholderia sp. Ac-20344]
MFSEGKHVALSGDEATCGNCDGLFKIVGSAARMTWNGRSVVLEGDSVLCPCGMNMVLAGSDCTIFYDDPGLLDRSRRTLVECLHARRRADDS